MPGAASCSPTPANHLHISGTKACSSLTWINTLQMVSAESPNADSGKITANRHRLANGMTFEMTRRI
jgi:hypothetical protein